MIDTMVDCKGAKAMSDGFQSHQVDTHLQYLEIFRGKLDFNFSEMMSVLRGIYMLQSIILALHTIILALHTIILALILWRVW